MSEIFLLLLNKSLTAGWIILAVLLLRLLLRRAPRWITCLLWGVAGVRLLLPFSVESVLSLIPSKEPIPYDIIVRPVPSVSTGVPLLNSTLNPILAGTFTQTAENGPSPIEIALTVGAWVWVIGVAALLLYGAVSYWRLKRQVRVSLRQNDNIYLCDDIDTPFILGIFRPRIYLPSHLAAETVDAVIAHEKAHLRRRDHWIKPLGFLLLAVYWFHPLVWVGYLLLCRDIEAACDEKVVKTMDTTARKAYSTALVQCSAHRRTVMACPLAFGEVGVKARVKAVLNYKKPAFWVVVAAVIVGVAVAVCFLTDPKDQQPDGITAQKSYGNVTLTIVKADLTSPGPYLTVQWNNRQAADITYGEPFALYRKEGDNWEDCATGDLVWAMPAYYMCAGGTSEITYSLTGQAMTQPGEYRLQASYTMGNRQEIAWVEFTLSRGVERGEVYTFDPVELVYCNGSYSYVMFPDAAPTWQLVNERDLYEIADDGIVRPIGKISRITLNDKYFDSRLKYAFPWEENAPSVEEIRRNNKRAWQVKQGDHRLYLLLEQKDGTFLMGYGSYDQDFSVSPNPDNSEIRWLYQLAVVNGAGIDMSQPAVNGATYFYNAATEEHTRPVFASYYQVSDRRLDALMVLLKDQEWMYDGLVDRTLFHLNGQMMYNDKWLYFGYDENVVLYGEYICTVPDEVIDLLREMEKAAVPFAATE